MVITHKTMNVTFWFLLEALVAAALLVLVVWWTWPRAGKNAQNKQNDQSHNKQEPPR